LAEGHLIVRHLSVVARIDADPLALPIAAVVIIGR
jgi:hypothetical protein